MYKLIFTPEAKEDVKSAAGCYEEQLRGLGKRSKQEVKDQLVLIKQNPFTRSIRYDAVRFAVIVSFPYSIHYSIDGEQITVHAIISDYRNPEAYWRKT